MPSLTIPVAAQNDDGYWGKIGGGSCHRAGTEVLCGLEDVAFSFGSSNTAWPCLRFVMPLDKRSRILSCRLHYRASATVGAGDILTRIGLEDVDDAVDLAANCLTHTRVMTTSYVAWTGALPTTINLWYYSPSFHGSLTEVLNRPGWVPGQHVAVMGHVIGGPVSRLEFYSFDVGAPSIPELVIKYANKNAGVSIF